ncbi:hypothetical protein PoB_003889200 [Plakobranchus ocellatus]|uniref:Uncharacterized protein n=1 Tax=Plakobranchus ocellatus TaxID=259542 RepID=A0AAV4AZE4_9GAST|nr:hypothetical protein PoB_003889200 [Plakobranchus ocellatus]
MDVRTNYHHSFGKSFEDHTFDVKTGYEELKNEASDLSGETNIFKGKGATSKSDKTELTQLVPASNGHCSSTAAPDKGFKFREIPTKSKVTLAMLLFSHFMAGCGFSVPGPFYPRELVDSMVISGFRPLLGHGAGGGARTRDGRVGADLRVDSLASVPPTPLSLMRR